MLSISWLVHLLQSCHGKNATLSGPVQVITKIELNYIEHFLKQTIW